MPDRPLPNAAVDGQALWSLSVGSVEHASHRADVSLHLAEHDVTVAVVFKVLQYGFSLPAVVLQA